MNWRDNPDSTYYADWAEDYSDMKQTLAIDFDGVIHDRPKSERGCMEVTGDPVPGAMHFIASVVNAFDVVIFSARFRGMDGQEALPIVKAWLLEQMEEYVNDRSRRGKKVAYITDIMKKIRYDGQKPIAHVYLDDRAMTFTGQWPTIEQIMKFKTWSEQLQEL